MVSMETRCLSMELSGEHQGKYLWRFAAMRLGTPQNGLGCPFRCHDQLRIYGDQGNIRGNAGNSLKWHVRWSVARLIDHVLVPLAGELVGVRLPHNGEPVDRQLVLIPEASLHPPADLLQHLAPDISIFQI